MILVGGHRFDLVLSLSLALILTSVAYGLLLLALSRSEPRRTATPGVADASADPFVVFVLPCLNEGRVIGQSLERLRTLDYANLHVVVVDDGSDDDTAAVVNTYADTNADTGRVTLLQRRLPEARRGKGEALNAALRYLRTCALLRDRNPADVIVCVVDADGRLEPHALNAVLPLFADPRLGAVQIGVRINNRQANLLARMQDIEFVLYTSVYQRGRRHFGSVGLGGNGQFVRLSALDSLGGAPWTDSLAEDLDLGIRLLVAGWDTEFCSATAVHQQGLTSVRRWLKQRTRWFQGHLQSWPLVPTILANLRGTRRIDLLYHVTSPFLLLVGSLLTVAFILWVLALGLAAATGQLTFSPWWMSSYLIAFGPALVFGTLYSRVERRASLGVLGVVGLVHLYTLYATLWYVAGWRATARILLGRSGWAKTERIDDDAESNGEANPTDANPTTEELPVVADPAREAMA